MEDLVVDGRILSKCIFIWMGRQDWIDVALVVSSCKCGNEPSAIIKCGEFIDWLRKC
jgi:hypothetical protein